MRYALIACATVCLMAVSIFMDLATADRGGSVMGAAAGLVGLAVSVWALAGPGRLSVEAHDGVVASGGHVGRVIVGHHNERTPHTVPSRRCPSASGSVRASGAGSTAPAGDADKVITGDGNRL